MGVPGLWDLIRPAAVRTSLSALARDAFLNNHNGQRALIIGIDASLWIFHAQTTQAGSNPFLRTLFYKIAALLQHPLSPLFVFDGPNKPTFKRGQKVTGQFGRNDYHSRQFKQLLDACGLEWWNAPGEAEAELALMNRQGKIDAVLSDDVDTLLFGAKCIIRNNSPTLSGTKSNATQLDQRHYEMFTTSGILKHWDVDGSALRNEDDLRRAMVLIALLGGGDYVPEGVFQFGPKISLGLAHAGCADFLRNYEKDGLISATRLDVAKRQIEEELRTNAGGHIGRRYKTRADALQTANGSTVFPSTSLESYLKPVTSGADPLKGWPGFGIGSATQTRGLARNTGRGDIEGMARACETYFEWGTREAVCKKFAGETVNLFGADIITAARQRILAVDKASTPPRPKRTQGPPTPPDDTRSPSRITSFFSNPLPSTRRLPKVDANKPEHLCKIHSSRKDPTSDDITEYRLAIKTNYFAERCRSAMDGTRVDPSLLTATQRSAIGLVEEARASADVAPLKDETRIWIGDFLLQSAWPVLITSYTEELAAKAAAKSAPKGKGRAKKTQAVKPRQENSEAFVAFFKSPQKASQGATRGSPSPSSRRKDGSDSLPSPASSGRELSEAPSEQVSLPHRRGGRSRPAASPSPSLFSDAQTPERTSQPARSRRRSTTAKSNQTGSAGDPITIDLSSDEEPTPVAPRRSSRRLSGNNSPAVTVSRIPRRVVSPAAVAVQAFSTAATSSRGAHSSTSEATRAASKVPILSPTSSQGSPVTRSQTRIGRLSTSASIDLDTPVAARRSPRLSAGGGGVNTSPLTRSPLSSVANVGTASTPRNPANRPASPTLSTATTVSPTSSRASSPFLRPHSMAGSTSGVSVTSSRGSPMSVSVASSRGSPMSISPAPSSAGRRSPRIAEASSRADPSPSQVAARLRSVQDTGSTPTASRLAGSNRPRTSSSLATSSLSPAPEAQLPTPTRKSTRPRPRTSQGQEPTPSARTSNGVLDSFIIARPRQTSAAKPPKKPTPRKKRSSVPYYVVTSESEDFEFIDMTAPRPS